MALTFKSNPQPLKPNKGIGPDPQAKLAPDCPGFGIAEGFTVLGFDSALDMAGLEAAPRNRGVPRKVLDTKPPAAAIFYPGGLVLSRPRPARGQARR